MEDYRLKLVNEYSDKSLKIFIRPSGTENVLRIHLEWVNMSGLEIEGVQEKIKNFMILSNLLWKLIIIEIN